MANGTSFPYNENFPFNESQMGEFSSAKNPFQMTDLASLLSQQAGAAKPDNATINELLNGPDTQRTLASGTPAVSADAAKLAAAKSIAYSTDIQPRWAEDKAQDVLNTEAAKAITPLENWYKYGSETAPTEPGSIEDLKSYTNLKTGMSYRALQDLGMEFPGTGATAPVFTSDAPAKGVGIGKAVQPATPAAPVGTVDKTGLTSTIGSEFGEVDDPARGGYTESNWNLGAWGDTISGKDTKLVALPVNTLKAYGNPSDANFAKEFNAKYDVQAVDPKTGKAVISALGDKGPGASTGAGIDLTYGTRAALGLPVNFKGALQYRIVPKGSALPSGTTSTGSTQPAAGTTPAQDFNTYIQPIDKRKLKDPEIYGIKNSDSDNMLWARNLTDQYATQMATAGAPLTVNEYKDRYKEFYDASVKKAQGEVAQALPAADSDRASSLMTMLPQLDALMEAKKNVGQFIPISSAVGAQGAPGGTDVTKYLFDALGKRIMPQNPKEADFYAKRGLVQPIVAAGLTGQHGQSLSDQDVANLQATMPLENDTVDEAQKKVDTLKQAGLDQLKLLIQTRRAGHFDTRDLEAQYLGLKSKMQPVIDQTTLNANLTKHSSSIAAKANAQQPQKRGPDWWLPNIPAPSGPATD